MINFLNLEYFLVAAEELNFTRAAKRLYISQQSLSNHISNLEKEFDVVLFNRTSPLTLTYAGQALQTRARQLLDLKDETYKKSLILRISLPASFLLAFPIPEDVLSFLRSFLPIKGNFRELNCIWWREIPVNWQMTFSTEILT